MPKYIATLLPYECATLEQEGKSIRFEFNQSREYIEELLRSFFPALTFDVPYYEAYHDVYYFDCIVR